MTIESVVRCLMDGDKPLRDFQCSAFPFTSKKPTFILIQIKIEKYLFLFNILLNCSKSYLPFSELDEIFNVSSKMILNMKLILTSKILILSFILINTKQLCSTLPRLCARSLQVVISYFNGNCVKATEVERSTRYISLSESKSLHSFITAY